MYMSFAHCIYSVVACPLCPSKHFLLDMPMIVMPSLKMLYPLLTLYSNKRLIIKRSGHAQAVL